MQSLVTDMLDLARPTPQGAQTSEAPRPSSTSAALWRARPSPSRPWPSNGSYLAMHGRAGHCRTGQRRAPQRAVAVLFGQRLQVHRPQGAPWP